MLTASHIPSRSPLHHETTGTRQQNRRQGNLTLCDLVPPGFLTSTSISADSSLPAEPLRKVSEPEHGAPPRHIAPVLFCSQSTICRRPGHDSSNRSLTHVGNKPQTAATPFVEFPAISESCHTYLLPCTSTVRLIAAPTPLFVKRP